MSTARILSLLTVEEYLESEKVSTVKREYVAGRVYMLAGSSDKHNRLAGRILTRLFDRAETLGCQAYMSDMKLQTTDKSFYYPDIMVICQDNDNTYFKTQPCLIIEVMSPSTAAVDRREKLEAYLKLASLQSYLLFQTETAKVTGYMRTAAGWLEQTWEGAGQVPLACLDMEMTLETLYANL